MKALKLLSDVGYKTDGFRSVLVRLSSSKSVTPLMSDNSDVPKLRVAPEVCVLLLFPLRGKGAGNINIRYRVEISLYCLSYQQEKWT